MRTWSNSALAIGEAQLAAIILGVIAVVVVPQFTSATQDTQGGELRNQLDLVNHQIELFRGRRGHYPTLAEFGSVDASGVHQTWGGLIDGGYLSSPPVNPVNGRVSVVDRLSPGEGWAWIVGQDNVGRLWACEFDHTSWRPMPGEAGRK